MEYKCSSPSPSARRAARHSVTRYTLHICTGRSASDCRCGVRLPEIPIIGSRSNLNPWIMLIHGSCWPCIFVGCDNILKLSQKKTNDAKKKQAAFPFMLTPVYGLSNMLTRSLACSLNYCSLMPESARLRHVSALPVSMAFIAGAGSSAAARS